MNIFIHTIIEYILRLGDSAICLHIHGLAKFSSESPDRVIEVHSFFLPWNLISYNKTLVSTQVVGWSSLHSIFPVMYIVFPDLQMLSLLPVKLFLPLSLHSALSFPKGQTHTSVHTQTHECSHAHIGTHYLSSCLNSCPQINLLRLRA